MGGRTDTKKTKTNRKHGGKKPSGGKAKIMRGLEKKMKGKYSGQTRWTEQVREKR